MDDPSKLFRLPGTIEEEEEKELENHRPGESLEKVESPLLGQKDVLTISSLPRNVTLIRVSTQSSSIAGGIGRQDSTRWGSPWVKLLFLFKIYIFVQITKIPPLFKNALKITSVTGCLIRHTLKVDTSYLSEWLSAPLRLTGVLHNFKQIRQKKERRTNRSLNLNRHHYHDNELQKKRKRLW